VLTISNIKTQNTQTLDTSLQASYTRRHESNQQHPSNSGGPTAGVLGCCILRTL